MEIGAEKRWDSTDAFVATCKAFDAIQKVKEATGKEKFLYTIEDINTLQEMLIYQGYAIQKIKTD